MGIIFGAGVLFGARSGCSVVFRGGGGGGRAGGGGNITRSGALGIVLDLEGSVAQVPSSFTAIWNTAGVVQPPNQLGWFSGINLEISTLDASSNDLSPFLRFVPIGSIITITDGANAATWTTSALPGWFPSDPQVEWSATAALISGNPDTDFANGDPVTVAITMP